MAFWSLTLAAFGAIDWAVVVCYFILILGIGVWTSRDQSDEQTYFVGGHTMPIWAVTLSVLATALSAATFIGAPQITYIGDLKYLILNIGGLIAALIVAMVFIPAFYRSGSLTIYGYLGKRFGTVSMMVSSIVFLMGRFLASGVRLFMAGIAVSMVLFGDIEVFSLVFSILLFGVFATLYTAVGGIRAVIWTDVLQIILVVGAALFSIYLLLDLIPMSMQEIVGVLRHHPEQNKLQILDFSANLSDPFTLWAALAATLTSIAAYGVDHDLAQRLLTLRSSWRGSLALILSNILAVPVVGLFLAIGLLLAVYYGMPELMGLSAPADAIDDSRKVYPQFLINHLPTGFTGLAVSGLVAAAMSSFDSAINAMASTVVADIYLPWIRWRERVCRQRRICVRCGYDLRKVTLVCSECGASLDTPIQFRGLHVSRCVVVTIGVILTLVATSFVFVQQSSGQDLINFALGIMSFAYAGLLGVFLTALLTRRGNTTSVVSGIIVGPVVVLMVQPYVLPHILHVVGCQEFSLAWPWWMVLGTTASFLVCLSGRGRSTTVDLPEHH